MTDLTDAAQLREEATRLLVSAAAARKRREYDYAATLVARATGYLNMAVKAQASAHEIEE